MKNVFGVVVLVVVSAVSFSCVAKQDKATKPDMKTAPEKYSYMIGLDIGSSLKDLGVPLDTNAVIYGIYDILRNRPHLMNDSQLTEVKKEFSMQMQQVQMMKMKEAGDKNTGAGDSLLEANKKLPGVVTTASGLQYQVVKKGTGPKPKATDNVKVNYKGMFIDGREFDSSYKRGQPAEFPVNGVIPGWSEALQLMNVGSVYKLVIPANLAYGERGVPQGGIGPNAVLVFEVELMEIVK
ncbi:MAG: FKBP-type peptidyl-prolyl cis-trans isomerase [Chitinispirillaceae bacterium]|jgi:FKBP-type peptidyl-prolyl cis-trans isomerase|nr:FKBP-type peptidyl-prolyl cis-trans isomerase [Chitinispirillaceae bacterium]